MKADRYLGLDTGGTGIKWVVTDPELAVVASGEVPTDPEHITVSLARVATAVGPELGAEADLHRLAGMGMAVAGIVDPVEGRLGRSPNLPGWEDKNLAKASRDVFGQVETAFANDVKVGGEWVGAQQGLLGNLTAVDLVRQYSWVSVSSFLAAYPAGAASGRVEFSVRIVDIHRASYRKRAMTDP